MDVKTLLLQQWTSCLDQEDWFPPLEKVLEDITLEQAIWKPMDNEFHLGNRLSFTFL
ncbi:hypothetical protein ACE1MS_12965 [Lysinibacillus sp. fkY74-1]